MAVDLDTLNRITADVVNGVKPEDSRWNYDAEMLGARAQIEAEIAAMPPGSVVDLPKELPPTDIGGTIF